MLANLDGLNDYDEDHHLIDTSITLDQTSYKVGKGYFDEAAEKLAELDDAPSGHGRRGFRRKFLNSSVNAEQAEEMDKTPGEIVAAVEETPAATRQAAATVPTDEIVGDERRRAEADPLPTCCGAIIFIPASADKHLVKR